MVHIDQNLKNELRNSHFHMGHYKSNFSTLNQSQFQPKDETVDNSMNKLIAENNKSYSHKMGTDKIVYDSESHVKFISPFLHKNKFQ